MPHRKLPSPGGSTDEIYQIFTKEIIPILHKLFWKTEKERMLPNLFYEVSVTLISKPEKDISRKEKHRPVFLIMNTDAKKKKKILSKILTNQLQQYTKGILHHDQGGFITGMQGWLNIQKSILLHETSSQAWCTGKTQRDWVERDVGRGIGKGNTCNSTADSCQCMTKTTTIL